MREIAQFFATLLAVLVVVKSWSDFRANRESWQMVIFWSIVWIVIALISFFPEITDIILNSSNASRSGIGTIMGMGLVFVTFILYRIYVKMERIERELTKLIKDIAIKEVIK